MIERLDFKTTRFDPVADSILIEGRQSVVEISRDAFEALFKREFTADELVLKAVEEAKRLNHLANVIPADDGKINITAALLIGDGQFNELQMNASGD